MKKSTWRARDDGTGALLGIERHTAESDSTFVTAFAENQRRLRLWPNFTDFVCDEPATAKH
jgi:hypothetical protein